MNSICKAVKLPLLDEKGASGFLSVKTNELEFMTFVFIFHGNFVPLQKENHNSYIMIYFIRSFFLFFFSLL